MENSIRGVFTLLKDHNKTPHYFCQGLSEEQTFPLGQSSFSPAPETFCVVSCQLHSFTPRCIPASSSIVIPCFPTTSNWCKTTSPAPQLTPAASAGGTRGQRHFQHCPDPPSHRGRGEQGHQGHKSWSTRIPSLPPPSTDRMVFHRSFSSPFTFSLERKEPRIVTVFITEHTIVF